VSEALFAPGEEGTDHAAHLAVGDVMLVLGDSLAVGIGAGHISEGAMALVASRLAVRRPGLTMMNLAIPSEGSCSMLAPGGQLDRAVEAIRGAHERGERVGPVTLSLGANDSIESAMLGELEAFRRFGENLETILTRLDTALAGQSDGIDGVLCMQTFYNPFPACEADPTLPPPDQLAPRRARTIDFNTAIRTAAARRGVRLADIETAFRGRECELTWLRSGDIHPNASGQGVMCDAFMTSGGWESHGGAPL